MGIPHTEVIFTVAICTILWLVGSILIYKKSSAQKATRRIIMLAIAFLGVALIVIQPHQKVNYEPEIIHLWTTDYNEKASADNNFNNVHDFLYSELVDKTSEVHIHGIGLEQAELNMLDGYPIVFHSGDAISGITNLSVPSITERKQWVLSGRFQGDDVERIYLEGLDQNNHFAALRDSTFSITSTAPVAGSYLFGINTILSSGDTLKEILPIEVNHEPTWQMLVLASYPLFENNYLKNYWTSLGNGFALRSKISKEKYNTTFVNSPKRNLDILTQRTIATYDFIITDSPTWNQLSANEQSNIKGAIRNNGLALIIRPVENQVLANGLQLPKWNTPTEIKWNTITDEVSMILYNIESSWPSVKLQGHSLASYQSRGLGHLAILGIDDTYKLILADHQDEYQDLWSSIFSKLYRDFSPTSKLLHDQWIWVGERNTIGIISDKEITTPIILNKDISLPYLKVPFINGVTEVSIWPEEGYNEIRFEDQPALKFYAHAKGRWPAVKQNLLMPINNTAAKRSLSIEDKIYETVKPYSYYWWYTLALFGFGGLWLDERLFG